MLQRVCVVCCILLSPGFLAIGVRGVLSAFIDPDWNWIFWLFWFVGRGVLLSWKKDIRLVTLLLLL
jgi:hypothetical protein